MFTVLFMYLDQTQVAWWPPCGLVGLVFGLYECLQYYLCT
jgi:hypothetical protein